ncbi:MAG: ABC transporter ATP-binding protein [Firmicutes bacterium HGW-Firmicutes-21]|nr:MAG: ABC transporter ATP-binding protein [Firmicutes bacterium HGW-Firmicutes-21]
MRKKTTDRKSAKRILSNNVFAIKTIYKISPFYVIYNMAIKVIDEVTIMLEHAFLVAYIIDCIEKGRPFSSIFPFFTTVTVLVLLRLTISPYIATHILPKHKERIDKELQLVLYKKATDMDISKYDDPEFYNDFVWAMKEAPVHVTGALTTLTEFIGTVTLVLCLGVFMVSVDIIGILFVVITLSLVLYLRMVSNKKKMSLEEEKRPVQRQRDYINRVFYLADFAKDLRMSEMSDKLYEDYKESSDIMEKTVNKHSRRISSLNYLASVVQNLLTFDGLYLTYLMYKTLALKEFGYGPMVALYNASRWLKNNLDELISVIPQFQEHSMYLEKMRTFLETENEMPDDGTKCVPTLGDIVLDNVSFAYPGNKENTLHNINLAIKKGEKIALVGYNGAGKSTLIKLLMRLYDPIEGEILYGGERTGEYRISDYRRRFGAVFQDHEIMASSLGENITMSTEPLDMVKAYDCFEKTDFSERYNSLKMGMETPMTKEFDKDGINLSGGEAQKVAISRVLYSDASVLILDEPSSALDPLSEYRLNRTIIDLARDKTVIIISHRLSTTRMVDNIYMLENGRIIENGTHDALITLNGKYAEMFNLQSEKYR